MRTIVTLLVLCTLAFSAKVELVVLGSGGPEFDGRASTSYLLFIDNKAKLIIDMGSGSMLSFEKSGAKLDDVDAVVLTHLHIDHAVDLPSYVKAGYFTPRTQPLSIIAPNGNEHFPSAEEYLESLFGKNGAYRYMNDILSKNTDSFELIATNIYKDRITMIQYPKFTLKLIRVHHGIVPALALRIDIGNKSILISGDTNNENKSLQDIAKDADLFIAHHAIAEWAEGYATSLHMKPSNIAQIAHDAKVKKIILTHRMKRTLKSEDESLKIIKKKFKGEVMFAEDGMRIEL